MNLQVADFAIIHQIHQHRRSVWVYAFSHCHQMITQQQPKGSQGLAEVNQDHPCLANACWPVNG